MSTLYALALALFFAGIAADHIIVRAVARWRGR